MVDAKIPEGIPTGVTPTPATAQNPYNLVGGAASSTPSVAPGEGLLDRLVKSLARFFARIAGLPDPITGKTPEPKPTATPAAKAESIVNKVWSTANKVVDKATTVATQAVDVTKSTVTQAVEQVKEVKADIASTQSVAPQEPSAPAQTQPLDTLGQTK